MDEIKQINIQTLLNKYALDILKWARDPVKTPDPTPSDLSTEYARKIINVVEGRDE